MNLDPNDYIDSGDWDQLTDDELTARLQQRKRPLGLTFTDGGLANIVRTRDNPNIGEWITQVLGR
jgi:hypothetical protein